MALHALPLLMTEVENHWSGAQKQMTQMITHLQQLDTLHQSQTEIENYLTREGANCCGRCCRRI